MRNFHYRRKNKTKIPFLIGFVLFMIVAVYIYMSNDFERESPKINAGDKVYWNLQKPIPLEISDNSGIKSYKISLIQEDKEILLEEKKSLKDYPKKINLELNYSKGRMLSTNAKTILKIEIEDKSYWNFFGGNELEKEIEVVIDEKKPLVNIISKSYALIQGGAGLVIFEAKDEHLSELYIESSEGRKFGVSKFLKDGFFIALISNDLRDKSFKMYIDAKDKAGNFTKTYIPFYYINRTYQTSKINLSEKFLDGKIEQLFSEISSKAGTTVSGIDRLDKFKFINEALRDANYEFIANYTSKVSNETIRDFNIKPFIPLINSAKVGSFGDHRFYQYNGKDVSQSYHMGIDFASTENDKIPVSNSGTIVYAGDNGIYGNTVIVDHGLGLYTIYSHCTTVAVSEGTKVKEGDIIGYTGTTGLALGDHLHFGILVQGIETKPEEWLDENWIKANITNIISDAKKTIGE